MPLDRRPAGNGNSCAALATLRAGVAAASRQFILSGAAGGVEGLGYRLLNWKERRALALPYFLRSTTRGSRVRKPSRFTTVRSPGS